MFGQACLSPGEAKTLMAQVIFLLATPVWCPCSACTLLTTVCYQIGDDDARYASKDRSPSPDHWCSGSATIWVCSPDRRRRKARRLRRRQRRSVLRTRLLGLFAPRWRPDARG